MCSRIRETNKNKVDPIFWDTLYLKTLVFWKCHNYKKNNPNFASSGCFGILRTSFWWWAQRFSKLMHPGLRNWHKQKSSSYWCQLYASLSYIQLFIPLLIFYVPLRTTIQDLTICIVQLKTPFDENDCTKIMLPHLFCKTENKSGLNLLTTLFMVQWLPMDIIWDLELCLMFIWTLN